MTGFLFHFICVYFFIFDDGKSTFFDMFGFKEPLFNCPPPDGFPSNSVDKALAIKTKNPTTLSMLLALGLCSSQLCNTYQLTVEARLCFLLFQLGKNISGNTYDITCLLSTCASRHLSSTKPKKATHEFYWRLVYSTPGVRARK